MTTLVEIDQQIDDILTSPEYIRLARMSRTPQEANNFAALELRIKTLKLRREDLVKREPLKTVSVPKRSAALVAVEKKESSVVKSPAKATRDPEPPRQALFPTRKARPAHLCAPAGPKPLPGAVQQELPTPVVSVPTPIPPPPADVTMSYAAGATPASVAAASAPQIKPPAMQSQILTPPVPTKPRLKMAGCVAPKPKTEGDVGGQSVAKPKTLTQLQVSEPVKVDQAKVDQAKVDAQLAKKYAIEDADDIDLEGLGLRNVDNIVEDIGQPGEISDLMGYSSEEEVKPKKNATPKAKKATTKTRK